MQHPVGYSVGTDGLLHLESLSEFLLNPVGVRHVFA